ncbi:phage tail tape measure C-terminal domain-containing protein [Acuticoccus sp. I52.16.1]|uniref:phage tail tape measure C-terminal domain-containing protein n=1 Tax=Acuticoccus sp. I52.16.1 TaxID=2928472 RepID=UPI00352BE104
MALGKNIGDTLVSAFRSAEEAFAEFVRTGKIDFRSLVSSMLVDMAKVAAQRFIFGPLSNALSAGIGRLGSVFASVFHDGGVVGQRAPMRLAPAAAFAGAHRYHAGGVAGLRPDEVPAILQRKKRVLSRRETAVLDRDRATGGVSVTIVAKDAESFRQSRTQVAADVARAVSLGRRGL